MVVQVIATAAARGAMTAGKVAARTGVQAVRGGVQTASRPVATLGKSLARNPRALVSGVNGKANLLKGEFGKYAGRSQAMEPEVSKKGKWNFFRKKKAQRKVRLFSYAGALMVALLKDLFDLAFIGSLPGVGTVITICCSIGILLMLIIAEDVTARSKAMFLMSAVPILVLGTLTESFAFGVNFFPVEVGMVIGIYIREKALGGAKGLLGKISSAGGI